MNSPRRRLVVLALTAVIGASACASVPSTKRVALDTVDAMAARGEISETERACMAERIDGYSEDRLSAIASGVEQADVVARADLAEFEELLAACRR